MAERKLESGQPDGGEAAASSVTLTLTSAGLCPAHPGHCRTLLPPGVGAWCSPKVDWESPRCLLGNLWISGLCTLGSWTPGA